jgi:hypothetical protein
MMLLLFALFFWIILSLIKGTRARCAAGDGEASLAVGLAHGSCSMWGGMRARMRQAAGNHACPARPGQHGASTRGRAKPSPRGRAPNYLGEGIRQP